MTTKAHIHEQFCVWCGETCATAEDHVPGCPESGRTRPEKSTVAAFPYMVPSKTAA